MIETLLKRRSTRKFLPNKVESDKVKQLLTAGLLSPSSKNNKPWEFITVDEPELLEYLSLSKPHGASFLKNAPLAIIVLGNTESSDVWVEDCSIASILIQLEAEKLDLGSCWVQIHKRIYNESQSASEYIRQKFEIPENLEVLSVIGIGYKAAERSPLKLEDIDWDKTHRNTY